MSEETFLSIGELLNKKVFVAHKKKEDTYRRIGKVRRFVFHPTEKRVIGFIMKRPDMALMFHRPDQFVAIDRIEPSDLTELADPTGINLAKLAIRYSDGVITASGGVNSELEAYAKQFKLPVLASRAISTEDNSYVEEYDKFYEQILA